ncbi:hypothetical protein EYF80_007551 [Liparis tanakae]|uniref:Uncharacterized protein n=1 Tax=Liparis tanakae TaxID=230148 RepID=A0A4Z2IY56_9TELE|nr:hypothetical protein EYF80_007551 [Liparis tanakae]
MNTTSHTRVHPGTKQSWYADQQSEQQHARQHGYEDDPPGNPVLVKCVLHVLTPAEYLSGSILEEQVFDAGLHSDVGSDQQLQGTDRCKLLPDRDRGTSTSAVPQPGMDLEDSVAGEAVEGALKEDAALSDLRLSDAATAGVVRPMLPFVATRPSSSGVSQVTFNLRAIRVRLASHLKSIRI